MTIQTFIEKAIEGGWKPQYPKEHFYECPPGSPFQVRAMPLYHEFLDPEAWKAVGKVEILRLDGEPESQNARGARIRDWATRNMHRMIDALAEGKSIEQYLETL